MAELPGGWSLDEIAAMARHVVNTQRGLILDREEALDVAAVAIVTRLYVDPEPSKLDLYRAARRAVGAANDSECTYAGLDRNAARSGREGTPPGWAIYWHGRTALCAPWEEDLTDRLAARQVWWALPERHQETLAALVAEGTYAGARDLLGVTHKRWEKRLSAARKRARELWFWPEEPAPRWSRDRPGLEPDSRGRNRGLGVVARKRRALTKEAA